MRWMLLAVTFTAVGCGRDRSYACCTDPHTMFEHFALGTEIGGATGLNRLNECDAPGGCVMTPGAVCYQSQDASLRARLLVTDVDAARECHEYAYAVGGDHRAYLRR